MAENKDNSVLLHSYKGVDYRLRFDYNIVCDMEEAERMDIPGIMMSGLPGFRKLVFYGLQTKHKTITKAKAGEIIQDMIANSGEENGLELVAKKLKQVLAEGKFITVEDEKEGEASDNEGEKKS